MRVPGSRFADLYAGSGAVGIEAISRGAAEVFFAEKSESALASAAIVLAMDGDTVGQVRIALGGVASVPWRAREAEAHLIGQPLDVVFLDPPYEDADAYQATLNALAGAELLRADSLVIAEHAKRQPLLETYGKLLRTRTLLQGDAALSFYRLHDDL